VLLPAPVGALQYRVAMPAEGGAQRYRERMRTAGPERCRVILQTAP
jgi:hypothetical protein